MQKARYREREAQTFPWVAIFTPQWVDFGVICVLFAVGWGVRWPIQSCLGSQGPSPKVHLNSSGATCPSPDSCSSWHKDCGFQKKPQGAGASQGWHAFEAKAFGHLCSFDRGQRPRGWARSLLSQAWGQHALLVQGPTWSPGSDPLDLDLGDQVSPKWLIVLW